MEIFKVLKESAVEAKKPVHAVPMILFSLETFYVLFNMLVPQYMPGFGNAIFLVFPDRADIIYLAIIALFAGSLFLAMHPSLASGATMKEAFALSCRRYPHVLASLLITSLSIVAVLYLILRISGFALSVSSISVPYVLFYISLLLIVLLISVFFVYSMPSVVLGGRNFALAIADSVKRAAKSYPKSLALLVIPVVLLFLFFFLLILLPFGYTTDITVMRLFMVLFVVLEAFVLSFAAFLFSYGYINS
jgi:hypothetical protein